MRGRRVGHRRLPYEGDGGGQGGGDVAGLDSAGPRSEEAGLKPAPTKARGRGLRGRVGIRGLADGSLGGGCW